MDINKLYDDLKNYRYKKNIEWQNNCKINENNHSQTLESKLVCTSNFTKTISDGYSAQSDNDVSSVLINDNDEENDINELIPNFKSWPPSKKCQIFFLKLLLWSTGFLFFVYAQFGAIYLICSILIFICLQTNTKSKSKNNIIHNENIQLNEPNQDVNSLSAYSVFNPNCEKIQGTFSGEDIDANLRSGGGGMINPLRFLF
ncbi:unnamed protein product [Gordionus sp. m RMFG-2023]